MADDNKSGDADDNYKRKVITDLLKMHVNLTDEQIAEVFKVDQITVAQTRQYLHRSTIDAMDTPITWDYVLAFNVGSDEEKVEPKDRDIKNRQGNEDNDEWENGMTQKKYYGQIFRDFWRRLEAARLNVRAYRSSDEKLMFLIVGITEINLKATADDRDTDLLLDPKGAVLAGRQKRMPLAQRTKLLESDDGDKCDIDITNWDHMYCQYNPRADTSIFKRYDRIPHDPTSNRTIFDEKTRLRIIYESIIADDAEGGAEIKIEDYLINKKHPLRAVFPLHDPQTQDHLDAIWRKRYFDVKTWLWCPVEEIRAYFGEPVGFYFAFLQFYMRWLIFPASIGLLFFIIQMATEQIDAPGVFLCAFFIIFWSVAFVDFWAREESRLRLRWGMTKFEQKAVARPQFNGDWKHDPVTGLWSEQFSFLKRGLRMTGVLTGVSFFLVGCLTVVLLILLARDGDPEDTELKIWLGVANGGCIFVFDLLYKKFSFIGNDWENHRTQQDYENAYIQKAFFFKFFNSFATLFYLAFVRPSVSGDEFYLRFYSAVNDVSNSYYTCECSDSYVATAYCLDDDGLDGTSWDSSTNECNLSGGGTEEADPDDTDSIATSKWAYCVDGYTYDGTDIDAACDSTDAQLAINETVMGELRIQLASLFITAIVVQNTLEVLIPYLVDKIKDYLREKKQLEDGGEILVRSEPEEQMDFEQYANTIDDMSEIIIQYGYVTLFVMALPITPLLAMVNNIFELKVDGYNLIRQTQRPNPNGSFGLGAWNTILSFFSIIAVATNVGLLTWRTALVQYISDLISSDAETASEFKWIFFSVCSVVLALIVAFEKWIIPDVPLAIEQAMERQSLIESVLVLGAATEEDAENAPSGDDGDFDFDPKAETIDVSTLKQIPETNLRFDGEDRGSGKTGGAGAGADSPDPNGAGQGQTSVDTYNKLQSDGGNE